MLIKIIVFYCELLPGMSAVGKDWQIAELTIIWWLSLLLSHVILYFYVFLTQFGPMDVKHTRRQTIHKINH